MLFIIEVVAWIQETYRNLLFSIVSFACPNLSTSFRKSTSFSQIDEGCDALPFIDILLIVVFRSLLKFRSVSCF